MRNIIPHNPMNQMYSFLVWINPAVTGLFGKIHNGQSQSHAQGHHVVAEGTSSQRPRTGSVTVF